MNLKWVLEGMKKRRYVAQKEWIFGVANEKSTVEFCEKFLIAFIHLQCQQILFSLTLSLSFSMQT